MKDEIIFDLLEAIGDAFHIELYDNDDIRDDIYLILRDDITQDLEHVLNKIKYYGNLKIIN